MHECQMNAGLTHSFSRDILAPMNQFHALKDLSKDYVHVGTAILVGDITGPEFTQ